MKNKDAQELCKIFEENKNGFRCAATAIVNNQIGKQSSRVEHKAFNKVWKEMYGKCDGNHDAEQIMKTNEIGYFYLLQVLIFEKTDTVNFYLSM